MASSSGFDEQTLERFADLMVGFGANVQKGQLVAIGAEIGKEEVARALAEAGGEEAVRHGVRVCETGAGGGEIKRGGARAADRPLH